MTTFLPTIAKQLGYSTIVVGTIYSILPILSLIIKPIVGAIVDQFRVKKLIFLTFILLSGLTAFSLMFVPEIPFNTTVEFNCHDVTFLNVCPENNEPLSKCSIKRVKENVGDQFGCEVNIDVCIVIRSIFISRFHLLLFTILLIIVLNIYLILVKM